MTSRLIFAGFWAFVILWLASHDLNARDAVSASKPNPSSFPTKVLGRGFTSELAKENALERAREEVIAFMRNQKPPLTAWNPSTDYIEKNWVIKGEAGDDEPLVDDKKTKTYYLTLRQVDFSVLQELDRQARIRLEEQERQLRSKNRSVLLAKILLGAVILLAGLIGLIRLDERTNHRYSRILYVSGVFALVATVGYVLFRLPF